MDDGYFHCSGTIWISFCARWNTKVCYTHRRFVNHCYCMFHVPVFLPAALLEMWIWKSWNGYGEVSALGGNRSWYVGHCPSSPIWLTDLLVYVWQRCSGEWHLCLTGAKLSFHHGVRAVSLNFWFSPVVVMSCGFLKICFLERGFYFPWLSVALLGGGDISVLPLAFQKNEENRVQAFCVTIQILQKVLVLKQMSCIC